MNPYYDADKLGLDIITLDEPDMSCEFNTLIFVRPKGQIGVVYTASDSGCSCPTPFENFEGESQETILAKLERVGSYGDAMAKFTSWNAPRDYHKQVAPSTFTDSGLEKWFA